MLEHCSCNNNNILVLQEITCQNCHVSSMCVSSATSFFISSDSQKYSKQQNVLRITEDDLITETRGCGD